MTQPADIDALSESTYAGWTGVQTSNGWVGYGLACLLPLFLVAFIVYLAYRLATGARGGEAGLMPWLIWLLIVVIGVVAVLAV